VLVFAAAAPCVHTHEPERGIALPKYPVIFMKTTATLNCHLGDIWRPNMTGEEDALNPGDSRLLAAARERFSKFCVFPLLGPEFPAGPDSLLGPAAAALLLLLPAGGRASPPLPVLASSGGEGRRLPAPTRGHRGSPLGRPRGWGDAGAVVAVVGRPVGSPAPPRARGTARSSS
jgi:hypothetical protein